MLTVWFSVSICKTGWAITELLRPVEFTQLYKSKFNGLSLLRVECCPKFIDYSWYGFNGGCLVIRHNDKLEYEREAPRMISKHIEEVYPLITWRS